MSLGNRKVSKLMAGGGVRFICAMVDSDTETKARAVAKFYGMTQANVVRLGILHMYELMQDEKMTATVG